MQREIALLPLLAIGASALQDDAAQHVPETAEASLSLDRAVLTVRQMAEADWLTSPVASRLSN